MKTEQQIKAAIAKNIQAFKKTENMTYPDLAEITGVNDRSAQAWANGAYMPSLYNAYLMADAMGMSLDELIGGTK